MRGRTVLVAGTALLAAGLAGCSKAGGGEASWTVDGKDQGTSKVQCATSNGKLTIKFDPNLTSLVELSDANPPQVQTVYIFANSDADKVMWSQGSPSGSAQATKDGNSYTITGTGDSTTGTGYDLKHVPRQFSVKATCPS
jgi:ipoprotein LpqH